MVFALPVKFNAFAIQKVLGRCLGFHPVQRNQAVLLDSSISECFSQLILFAASGHIGLAGNEQAGAAAREGLQPLAIQAPVDVSGDAHTIGIGAKEAIVLHQTEGEGIDSHFFCARPFKAAGIVAGTVELMQSGTQMSDGIASDEDSIAGSLLDGLVKLDDNFRGCFGVVEKSPISGC